jgi:Ca2+-binding RTX toxin-like protein
MAAASKALTFIWADQDSESLYLSTDRNGDGDVADSRETSVFFDAGNRSGLADPLVSPLDLFQAKGGAVLVSDNATDSVYRLMDRNGDGDANDKGEAKVWFSAAGNAEGFTLATPNGLAEDPYGAVYVVLAGTGSAPLDAVYRTIDRNGDGDADDAGEASIWLDLQTLNSRASAFEINFVGDVAYVSDTVGGDPDVIHRIEDKNHSGDIDAGEATVFISDDNAFGVNVEYPFVFAGDVAYNWEFARSGGPNRLFALQDKDGSGSIDQASEAKEVWDETYLPAGHAVSVGPGIGIGSDGSILLAANGTGDVADDLIRLVDRNGDGDFKDAGETSIVLSSADGADHLSKPRPIEGYQAPKVNEDHGGLLVDRVALSEASDHYRGMGGDDVISGRGGGDTLFGNAGNDRLSGDNGADRLFGGNGGDLLVGGNGDDYLDGGKGADTLVAGNGSDQLFGHEGNDLLIVDTWQGAKTPDVADGGAGRDTLGFELSPSLAHTAAFKADLSALQALADAGQPFTYEFHSLGLTVRDIEAVELLPF